MRIEFFQHSRREKRHGAYRVYELKTDYQRYS